MASEKKAQKKAGRKATKQKPVDVVEQEELEEQMSEELVDVEDLDDEIVGKPGRRRRRKDVDDDDDLPPDDEEELDETLDADKLVAEVEQGESEGQSEDEGDANLQAAPLPSFTTDEDSALDAETILPTMEGMSILRETELNDVINDVKRRSEANGGYITYEELNQILPSNIVDAIQSDRYLKILEALGVQVLREEDVKKWVEAKNLKSADPKARAAEMIEDPIRMYLHQMGQVQLLSRDEEVTICQTIEDAEVKTRDMFNRFLFAPPMYARLLDKLEGQCERFDRIVTDKFDEKRDAYMALIPGFRKQIKESEKRLRDARSEYLATIAKKDVSPATLRGAETTLAHSRHCRAPRPNATTRPLYSTTRRKPKSRDKGDRRAKRTGGGRPRRARPSRAPVHTDGIGHWCLRRFRLASTQSTHTSPFKHRSVDGDRGRCRRDTGRTVRYGVQARGEVPFYAEYAHHPCIFASR